MGKLEIGLYDVFSQATMAASPVAADVYDEHIRSAQEADAASPLQTLYPLLRQVPARPRRAQGRWGMRHLWRG